MNTLSKTHTETPIPPLETMGDYSLAANYMTSISADNTLLPLLEQNMYDFDMKELFENYQRPADSLRAEMLKQEFKGFDAMAKGWGADAAGSREDAVSVFGEEFVAGYESLPIGIARDVMAGDMLLTMRHGMKSDSEARAVLNYRENNEATEDVWGKQQVWQHYKSGRKPEFVRQKKRGEMFASLEPQHGKLLDSLLKNDSLKTALDGVEWETEEQREFVKQEFGINSEYFKSVQRLKAMAKSRGINLVLDDEKKLPKKELMESVIRLADKNRESMKQKSYGRTKFTTKSKPRDEFKDEKNLTDVYSAKLGDFMLELHKEDPQAFALFKEIYHEHIRKQRNDGTAFISPFVQSVSNAMSYNVAQITDYSVAPIQRGDVVTAGAMGGAMTFGVTSPEGVARQIEPEGDAAKVRRLVQSMNKELTSSPDGSGWIRGMTDSLGMMAGTTVSFVATRGASTFGQVSDETYHGLRAEGSGVFESLARGVTQGAIMTAVERIGGEFFGRTLTRAAGKVPGAQALLGYTGGAVDSLKRGMYGSALRRGGVFAVGAGASELAEEYISATLSVPADAALAALFGSDNGMTYDDWLATMDELASPDLAIQMMIFGAGVTVFQMPTLAREAKISRKSAAEIQALTGANYEDAKKTESIINPTDKAKAIIGLSKDSTLLAAEQLENVRQGIEGMKADHTALLELGAYQAQLELGQAPRYVSQDDGTWLAFDREPKDAGGYTESKEPRKLSAEQFEAEARINVEAAYFESVTAMQSNLLAKALIGHLQQTHGSKITFEDMGDTETLASLERMAVAAQVKMDEGANAGDIAPELSTHMTLGQMAQLPNAAERRVDVAHAQGEQVEGFASNAYRLRMKKGRHLMRYAAGKITTDNLIEDLVECSLEDHIEQRGISLDWLAGNLRELQDMPEIQKALHSKKLISKDGEVDMQAVLEGMGILARADFMSRIDSLRIPEFVKDFMKWVRSMFVAGQHGAELGHAFKSLADAGRITPKFAEAIFEATGLLEKQWGGLNLEGGSFEAAWESYELQRGQAQETDKTHTPSATESVQAVNEQIQVVKATNLLNGLADEGEYSTEERADFSMSASLVNINTLQHKNKNIEYTRNGQFRITNIKNQRLEASDLQVEESMGGEKRSHDGGGSRQASGDLLSGQYHPESGLQAEGYEGASRAPRARDYLRSLSSKSYQVPKSLVAKALDNEFYLGELLELAQGIEGARAFQSAISEARTARGIKGDCVYVYEAEEYADMRLFLSPDGMAGLALKEDGDMVSVFKHPVQKTEGSVINSLLALAVSEGATKADCYGKFLTDLYGRFGFKPAIRDKFNAEYAPDAMQNVDMMSAAFAYENGEPPVYYLAYYGDRQSILDDYHKAYSTVEEDVPFASSDDTYSESLTAQEKMLTRAANHEAAIGASPSFSLVHTKQILEDILAPRKDEKIVRGLIARVNKSLKDWRIACAGSGSIESMAAGARAFGEIGSLVADIRRFYPAQYTRKLDYLSKMAAPFARSMDKGELAGYGKIPRELMDEMQAAIDKVQPKPKFERLSKEERASLITDVESKYPDITIDKVTSEERAELLAEVNERLGAAPDDKVDNKEREALKNTIAKRIPLPEALKGKELEAAVEEKLSALREKNPKMRDSTLMTRRVELREKAKRAHADSMAKLKKQRAEAYEEELASLKKEHKALKTEYADKRKSSYKEALAHLKQKIKEKKGDIKTAIKERRDEINEDYAAAKEARKIVTRALAAGRLEMIVTDILEEALKQVELYLGDKKTASTMELVSRLMPKRMPSGKLSKGKISLKEFNDIALYMSMMSVDADIAASQIEVLKGILTRTQDGSTVLYAFGDFKEKIDADMAEDIIAAWLTYGDIESQSLDAKLNAMNKLTSKIITGKHTWNAVAKLQKDRIESLAKNTRKSVHAKTPVHSGTTTTAKKDEVGKIKTRWNNFMDSLSSFTHLLEYVGHKVPALKSITELLKTQVLNGESNMRLKSDKHAEQKLTMYRKVYECSKAEALKKMEEHHTTKKTGAQTSKTTESKTELSGKLADEYIACHYAGDVKGIEDIQARVKAEAKRDAVEEARRGYLPSSAMAALAKERAAHPKARSITVTRIVSNPDGVSRDIYMSKREAMFVIMLWEQDGYRSNILNNGYDEATMAAIYQYVGSDALRIAYEWREYIQVNGIEFAAEYERLTNVKFPAVNNYFRAQFENHKADVKAAEIARNNTLVSNKYGSTITRVNHNLALDFSLDIFKVGDAALAEQDHYVEFKAITESARKIFSHNDMARSLQVAIGSNRYRRLMRWIEVIDGAGTTEAAAIVSYGRMQSTMQSARAIVLLGFNFVTMVKQLTAQLNPLGSDYINPAEFLQGYALTVNGGHFSTKDIRSMPAIQSRYSRFQSVKKIVALGADQKFSRGEALANAAMQPMEYIDVEANILAYTAMSNAVYARLERQNKTAKTNGEQEFTVEQMEEMTRDMVINAIGTSAQPMGKASKSLMQAEGHVLTRALFFMASESIQKYGSFVTLIQTGQYGKAAAMYAAFATSEQLIVSLFSYLANPPEDEEEAEFWITQLKSIPFAPLGSIPLFGAAIKEAVSRLGFGKHYNNMGNIILPVGRTGRLIWKASTDYDEMSVEEWTNVVISVIQLLGMSSGLVLNSRSRVISSAASWSLGAAVTMNIPKAILRYMPEDWKE